jgi:hypothetical protein
MTQCPESPYIVYQSSDINQWRHRARGGTRERLTRFYPRCICGLSDELKEKKDMRTFLRDTQALLNVLKGPIEDAFKNTANIIMT